MSRYLKGTLTLPAVAIGLAFAIQPSAMAAPSIVSESATQSSANGVTFTATINTHGEEYSGLGELEWGDSEYVRPSATFNAEAIPKASFPDPIQVQSPPIARGDESNHTISYTAPAALNEAFALRWPDGLVWIHEDELENELWHWQRPALTETIHYRWVVAGTTDGPDQTIASPAPTMAPSVSTGPVQVKPFDVHHVAYFTGTLNEHAQGYAWYAVQYGKTKSYGHMCTPHQGGDTPYWVTSQKSATGGIEFVDAPTSDATHSISLPCLELEPSPPPGDAYRPAPGATYHYRLVADNGYGSSPVYGQDRTFTVPGGKSSTGKKASKHHKKSSKRKSAHKHRNGKSQR
ncbi:MAG TPA: hypothetical protein VGF95_05005 [Solirubrobacteraceae bacterium]